MQGEDKQAQEVKSVGGRTAGQQGSRAAGQEEEGRRAGEQVSRSKQEQVKGVVEKRMSLMNYVKAHQGQEFEGR